MRGGDRRRSDAAEVHGLLSQAAERNHDVPRRGLENQKDRREPALLRIPGKSRSLWELTWRSWRLLRLRCWRHRDSHQLRDLQDFRKFGAQVAKTERCALVFCAVMRATSVPRPALSMNVIFPCSARFSFSPRPPEIHLFAQGATLFAQNDSHPTPQLLRRPLRESSALRPLYFPPHPSTDTGGNPGRNRKAYPLSSNSQSGLLPAKTALRSIVVRAGL